MNGFSKIDAESMSEGTIYVDLDDVLCHTARGCLAIVEREFGKKIAFDQLHRFELELACGLSAQEMAELYRIVHLPDELLQLEPVDGAASTLDQWAAAGYAIWIVTGRPPSTYDVSVEWAVRNGIPHHALMVVDKYRRFPTENTIGLTLDELTAYHFCWAVEDSPIMAEFLTRRMQVPVALLDRPWNRTLAANAGVQRYSHWHEIAAVFPNGEAGTRSLV